MGCEVKKVAQEKNSAFPNLNGLTLPIFLQLALSHFYSGTTGEGKSPQGKSKDPA